MNRKAIMSSGINNHGNKLEKCLAWILGFLCCNNIFYAFVVGSTPIMFIYVYAIFALAVLIVKNNGVFPNFWLYIPTSLKLFLIFVLLSGFSTLLIYTSYMYQYFVGIIQLFLHVLLIVLIMWLSDCKNDIYKGIAVGILVNFVLVVYGYIRYRQGAVFTLNDFFPAIEIKTQYIGNSYRGVGLFKEPGHLMRFVAIIIFPVFTSLFDKFSFKALILLMAVLVISAFSLSSSLIILLVGCVVYYLVINPTDILKKIFLLIGLTIAVSLVLLVAKSSPGLSVLVDSFQAGLEDVFFDSSGNKIRADGISGALEVIKRTAPLGSGWNTFTKVFESLGYYSENVKGAYSEMLSLIAEVGFFSVLYIWFVLSTSASYLKQNKNVACVSLGVALLIYLSLMFMTDFGLEPGMAVLLGVAFGNKMKSYERKSNLLSAE